MFKHFDFRNGGLLKWGGGGGAGGEGGEGV